MAQQTIMARGAHNADFFQNEMFPDKISGAQGHFAVIAEDSGVPFCNWTNRMVLAYQNDNITFDVDWGSLSVTTGAVVWQVEIERLAPDGNPLNAANFDTPQSVTDTVSGTLSAISRASITFTNAEFDGVQSGESFRLRLTRNTSSGSDTMVGDAWIINWTLRSDFDD